MTQTVTRSNTNYRMAILLWVSSLAIYLPLVSTWCLSGDEYYTWDDSANYTIAEMLGFNSRPLYFIVCHYLLKWLPSWPVELVIRIPAVVAASLVAPCICALLPKQRFRNAGLFAAILAMLNPWVFQMSQFGRYYAFVILFATIATLAILRFLGSPQPIRWGVLFGIAVLLATVSHPPAILLLPAGIGGILAARMHEDPKAVLRFLRHYGVQSFLALAAIGLVAIYLLRDVLYEWATAPSGGFGGNSIPSIVMGLLIVGGLSSWALALVPMVRAPSSWVAEDWLLGTMLIIGSVPLLMLVPFGGGIAARYFLYCLPCMFLLAALHWDDIDRGQKFLGYRLTLGAMVLGCNVPYLFSVAADGDHFDHRTIARAIENSGVENPVIFSSGHRLVDHYLDDRFEVHQHPENDLGEFMNGVPKGKIELAIDLAQSEKRPLLLVSRQDRALLTPEDQKWLYERFAVLRTVETARYDHRRHRVILYHYRPMEKHRQNASL